MHLRIALLLIATLFAASCGEDPDSLSEERSLSINLNAASDRAGIFHFMLPESDDFRSIPQDPQNRITKEKIELGQMLFHETAFALDGEFDNMAQTYSCGSCHNPKSGFHSGRMQGIADGGMGFGIAGESRIMAPDLDESLIDVQQIRVPSNLNAAYQTNLLWNGKLGATNLNEDTKDFWKKDDDTDKNFLGYEGLETQAIVGLQFHRMKYDEELITQFGYKEMFDKAFGDIDSDDRYTFERAGQAIAAFERTMLSNKAPFQEWLRGSQNALTASQLAGASLFFGKAGCFNCHNGPSLAKMEFAAIGFNDFTSEVLNHNPDDASKFGRASFTQDDDDLYKFKIPQLYNLKDVKFFGHGSSFTSVREVIEYKNAAQAQNPEVSDNQLSEFFVPLNLSETEIDELVDFIENGLFDPDLERYLPASVQSGNCFPNNDAESKKDLGCS